MTDINNLIIETNSNEYVTISFLFLQRGVSVTVKVAVDICELNYIQ